MTPIEIAGLIRDGLLGSLGFVPGSFLQFLVGHDRDIHAAVLLAAVGRVFRRDRLGLAVARGRKPGRAHFQLGQIIGNGQGPVCFLLAYDPVKEETKLKAER